MYRLRLAALLLLLPLTASAVDDLRVNQLEQEVRDLKRQVQVLTRQVDELRNRPARLNAPRDRPDSAGSVASGDWVDSTKWNRIRPGMSELEVVSVLGPPTTMRDANGAKVLRYALEIGSGGGFLSGSVTLRDRVVVEIQKPELQ